VFSGSYRPRNPARRSSSIDRVTLFGVLPVIALGLILDGVAPAFGDSNPRRQSAKESAQESAKEPDKGSGKPSVDAEAARGKYLVEGVAMCGSCHTPLDAQGNPDRIRWLQGAPVLWQQTRPDSPLVAPRIGSTPPASDAAMVTLLTTGVWTTGKRLRYPMPQFRMDRKDAEAVVAYLKSLTPRINPAGFLPSSPARHRTRLAAGKSQGTQGLHCIPAAVSQ
jgi:mono/diheme cytochrome c family protein